jgi:hypothetical protein
MPRRWNLLLLAAAFTGLLFAATGCKDKDDPEPVPVPQYVLPFPDTPDQLMANFKTAYTDMDLDVYRDEVLRPDYTFVLLNETMEHFGLPDNLFEFADEVLITEKMFAGQPNEAGRVISDIEIQVLQPQGAWLPVLEADPYFGSVPGILYRNYNILIYFNMAGQFRYEVQGNQLFYVAPDTVMHEGVMTPRYRLRGQLDQTSAMLDKGTESNTWGSVKALFY